MTEIRSLAVIQLVSPHGRRGGTDPFAEDFSPRAALVAAKERAEAWLEVIDQAAQGAQLVVATEDISDLGIYARLLESPSVLRSSADTIPGRLSEALGRIAKRRNTHIIAGYYEREARRVFNSAVLIGPKGRPLGISRKLLLSPGEEWVVAAGAGVAVFPTAIGSVGIAIGDDLLHAEIGAALARLGADIVAWPTRVDPGDLIARARAVDHGYTILIAHPGRSRIIDRRGAVLADGAGRPRVVLKTEVDIALPDEEPPPPSDPSALLGYGDRRERLARRRRPELLDVLLAKEPPELDRYRSHRIPRKPGELRLVYRRMVDLLRGPATHG